MHMKRIYGLVLFFCVFIPLGLAAAYREVAVSEDSNEYGTISAEELKAAETDFRNANVISKNVFIYPEA